MCACTCTHRCVLSLPFSYFSICNPVQFQFSRCHVWLFATPWTTARQASLSITNSRSPLKPMSIESVMPSSHLILCRPLLLLPSIFPASGSFPMSQLFTSGGQSIGVSASASILPMNTQDWPPLGWTGWISLQIKGLSRVFSNTTVQKHQFFGSILQLNTTLFSIYLTFSKLEQKLPNPESYLTTIFQFFTKPGKIFGAMNNWSFLELGLSK